MLLNFKKKKLYIDDQPQIILSGEIHYYRLNKEDWQHAIDELKAAGFNTVATYIPWVIHEQIEGDIDLTGNHKPQYDIISFMKLVKENDLYFIARPGPFVMAEMINDGIPTWVKEKYPDCVPTCWDNQPATTVDLDYLNDGFLASAKNWYSKIIPEIAKYQNDNLLGVQLDNEMGMLAWVSNSPVLTDSTIEKLIEYMKNDSRSAFLNIDLDDFNACKSLFKSPTEEISLVYHDLLHDFYREKIKVYTEYLEAYCLEYGLDDTLFMINIHGTGGGLLYGYGVGVSQLYKTYENKSNYVSGSDIYFDSLTANKLHDTYLSSAMTEAVNDENQPLTSLEFNASDTDFGFNHGGRALSCTNNHRARLLLGQGTKLFNFYLFSGGFNDYMNAPLGDGVDRIATTGEKHGFGSPLRQDLTRNYTFDATSSFGNTISNLAPKLATMTQVYDNINIGFIPDYFKNEFVYPHSKLINDVVGNIKKHTLDEANTVLMRYLLLRNYMPTCINIQDHAIDINKTKVLALNSAKYMAANTQQNIADFLKKGGKLLLFGDVPVFDLHGNECTILIDALGVSRVKEINYEYPSKMRISVTPSGFADGLPQTFVNYATNITSSKQSETILKTHDGDQSIGLFINDDVVAALVTTQYRCDMMFFDKVLEELGVQKTVDVDTDFIGTYTTLLENEDEEKFLNVLNLDDFGRSITINTPFLQNFKLDLEAHDAMLIPVNLKLPVGTINYATNELYSYTDTSLTFKLSTASMHFKITTDLKPAANDLINVDLISDSTYIISLPERKYGQDFLEINFE